MQRRPNQGAGALQFDHRHRRDRRMRAAQDAIWRNYRVNGESAARRLMTRDRRDESITEVPNGRDVAAGLLLAAERDANRPDSLRDALVGDGLAVPTSASDVLFVDDFAHAGDEQQQDADAAIGQIDRI